MVVAPLKMARQLAKPLLKKTTVMPSKEPSHLDLVTLKDPERGEGSKWEFDWTAIGGGLRQLEGFQRQLREWWRVKANMRRRVSDWAVHIFRGQ